MRAERAQLTNVRLSVVLAMLASLALELALHESGEGWLRIACVLAIQVILLAVGQRYVGRLAARGAPPAGTVSLAVAGLILLPLVYEACLRSFTGFGRPFEVLLICGLRDVTLGLAMMSYWPVYQRLCASLSLFVMLFSASISSHPGTFAAVVLFAIVGVWWLMGNHWDTLRARIHAESKQDLPTQWLLLSAGIVTLLLATVSVGENRVANALTGFMPSSGGTRWYDPSARGGVNDGDALVPGTEDAHSFGPIESEIFKESKESSLYDALDDTYGEPYFPKTLERAVSLPRELVLEIERRMSQTKQAGREFSTLRRRSARQRPVAGIDSQALFYVSGRTPLHLRMEVFDLFDGITWHPEPPPESYPELEMEEVAGKQWLRIRSRYSSPILYGNDSHALRVISLDSNRLPAPSHLLGVHIDKVDNRHFFKFEQEGILALNRKKIPPLTVIHLQSQLANLENRRELYVPRVGPGRYSSVPDDFHTREIARIAAQWVHEVPSGWDEVEMIVSRLHETCVHDRSATAPEGCIHPAAWFLLESRRGADYHFATTAALMLRSLGYQVRLASGFYADPRNYDLRSRQTPVGADDVHVWPEVKLHPGTWVSIEPTPGYELLGPPPGLLEQVVGVLAVLSESAYRHRVGIISLAVLGCLVMAFRVPLLDRLAICWWRLAPGGTPRQQVIRGLQLLELRCRWAGAARPPGMPATTWFRRLAHGDGADPLERLLQLADWAAFAPLSETSDVEYRVEVAASIRQSLTTWSLSRLRGALQRCGLVEERRSRPSHMLHATWQGFGRGIAWVRPARVFATRGGAAR